MDIRIEGYDEYVKDFEEARNTTEVLPKTEEEIREIVEEAWKMKDLSIALAGLNPIDCIIDKNSVDGKYHEFGFDVEIYEDEHVVLLYRPKI